MTAEVDRAMEDPHNLDSLRADQEKDHVPLVSGTPVAFAKFWPGPGRFGVRRDLFHKRSKPSEILLFLLWSPDSFRKTKKGMTQESSTKVFP
jgi:hypothetical protein